MTLLSLLPLTHTMALIHRKLFTWFLLLLFLILAGLRLDGRTHWNWLVVMVPVWLFDVLLLLHIALLTVSDCRSAFFGLDPLPERIKAVAYRFYQVSVTCVEFFFRYLSRRHLQTQQYDIDLLFQSVRIILIVHPHANVCFTLKS